MKHILLIIGVLYGSFSFSQRTELRKWVFYSDKNTEKTEVILPHTWNAVDAFDDKPGYWRGKAYYLNEITISNLDKDYYLHFNGANQITRIWVNNQFAGEHKGGYTAFDIHITRFLIKGGNSVKVEVENTHNESIPPLEADFTFYGGIYRKVYLIAENQLHFKKEYGADAIKIDALLDENYDGKIKISGKITNNSNKGSLIKIKVSGTDNNVILKNVTDVFSTEIPLVKPMLWSPDQPNLYQIQIQLYDKNKLLDTYTSTIGFRKFDVSTKGFKLNGKPLKLIGVNRHQDWKDLGNAVPIEKQLKDMVMIKKMGSNFLRLAHYPQDKSLYNAADSLGIILWSEIPVVNKVPATSHYQSFKTNVLQMQQEHIAQNYNHPSLVFIGYMNEVFLRMAFDKPDKKTKDKIVENTLDLAKELENLTRKLAPEHITVMALHGNQIYNETGIADLPMVIGWNLYYGWYGGEMKDLGGFLDEEFLQYPQRPLIISEYGVGADIRIHNDHSKMSDFSEEYQFKYHPSYYKQVIDRDFVIGMSAWNYADFGSELRGDAIPHVNQKGLVNFNRSPKNIYYWYKSTLNPDDKMSRFFKGLDTYISDHPKKEIIIITNQKVILKDNFNLKSELKPSNNLISYSANLAEGKNRFELYNESGVFLDSIQIHYSKPDLNKIDELAVNLGTESFFKGNTNCLWVPLKEVTSVIEVEGNYKKITSNTNIKNTDNDPIYQSNLSNIKEININVPQGDYEITLLFSEFKKDHKLVYELDKEKNENNTSSFSKLYVNNKTINIDRLAPFNKKDISVNIKATNKIKIGNVEKQGFSLCGIKIRKL